MGQRQDLRGAKEDGGAESGRGCVGACSGDGIRPLDRETVVDSGFSPAGGTLVAIAAVRRESGAESTPGESVRGHARSGCTK